MSVFLCVFEHQHQAGSDAHPGLVRMQSLVRGTSVREIHEKVLEEKDKVFNRCCSCFIVIGVSFYFVVLVVLLLLLLCCCYCGGDGGLRRRYLWSTAVLF